MNADDKNVSHNSPEPEPAHQDLDESCGLLTDPKLKTKKSVGEAAEDKAQQSDPVFQHLVCKQRRQKSRWLARYTADEEISIRETNRDAALEEMAE
jgi:hypothetical protein